MLNAAWQVDHADWDTLKASVKEAFNVELVEPDDEFSFEELFCVLKEEHGLDPCKYKQDDCWRVHADRATNWWGEDVDICVAGARAAMSWYLSRPENDKHPIFGQNSS